MISESNIKLPILGKSRGKIVFRYDFIDVEKKNDRGDDEKHYRFKEVLLAPPVDRDRLIDAVISSQYSKSAEIAMINNKISAVKGADAEYKTYQAFRVKVKAMVDEAIK
jgi:hypothetical protein